mgnify:CR=1 FL=1
MKSIEKITEHTLVIKKSEFICTLIPLNDEEKINETIDYYKEKYKDATHNCVAYLVGTKERANDDGEPSGTAGAPMLNILQGSNICNIIVIVTRYFGGILLGTGGLVRAYSDATKKAIQKLSLIHI